MNSMADDSIQKRLGHACHAYCANHIRRRPSTYLKCMNVWFADVGTLALDLQVRPLGLEPKIPTSPVKSTSCMSQNACSLAKSNVSVSNAKR
jgi:hypothetical protein